VPSDLGTFLLVRKARQVIAPTASISSVTTYVTVNGSASGGTIASVLAMARTPLKYSGPLALAPVSMDRVAAKKIVAAGASRGLLPAWAPDVRRWQHFWLMSIPNTAVVRRSAMLFAAHGAAITQQVRLQDAGGRATDLPDI
jgi:hypothetical protein